VLRHTCQHFDGTILDGNSAATTTSLVCKIHAGMTQEESLNTQPDDNRLHEGRRNFLKQSALLSAMSVAPPQLLKAAESRLDEKAAAYFELLPLSIEVNGTRHKLSIEPRVTLLDLLREQLALPGTKKGCDHGQCGACTVHVDGRRILSCMSMAVMLEGKKVTTIEGLSNGDRLHPMQQAFITHDGFQCGYCTPGQIMSGIACIREGHADSDDEIREYMSGNICRCGAYPNIVKAIAEVKKGGHQL
jgi:xanthine dehydrogenase YagT iron-sulfur-binding subunit